MKNKMLILTAVLLFSSIANAFFEQSGIDKLIEFKKMEKFHKDDWFYFTKSIHNAKYDMLRRDHDEWVDFGIQNLMELKNTKDFSAETKNELFENQLKKAIALHKKQLADWKSFCEKNQIKGKELRKKHAAQLNAFIEKNLYTPKVVKK